MAADVSLPEGFELDPPQNSNLPPGFELDEPSIPQAAGHAFVNNLPFGGQGAAEVKSLFNKQGYSQNLADWNAQTVTDKAAHPIVYGAGAVGGTIAPLFIPGIGEAVKAAPILSSAALGAADAMGNTDLTKSPMTALKQGIGGAVLGAGTAGVIGSLMPSPASVSDFAERNAVKSLNLPAGRLVNMAPEERSALGQMAIKNGLVGENKETALKAANDLMNSYGQTIGQIGETSSQLGLAATPQEHLQAVQALKDKASEYANSFLSDGKKLARDYNNSANEILNLPANPSWNDIQALKVRLGNMAFDNQGGVKNKAIADAYFETKNMLNNIAQRGIQDPSMPDAYKAALAGYSQLHPVVEGLEKSADASLRGANSMGQSVFPSRMLMNMPRSIRYPIGGLAVAAGHPYLGSIAVLPDLANPAMLSKVASKVAPAIPSITQGVNQAVTQAATSAVDQKLALTEEKARQFLQQAGGDKEKARQLASQSGYSF